MPLANGSIVAATTRSDQLGIDVYYKHLKLFGARNNLLVQLFKRRPCLARRKHRKCTGCDVGMVLGKARGARKAVRLVHELECCLHVARLGEAARNKLAKK